MAPVIIGFGEALIDKLPSGEVVGGAPLNFAVRAAELGDHFGCAAAIVTRLGRDPHGEMVLERLKASKLNLSAVQFDASLPTGFVDVALDAQGQPSYTIGRNVAWDAIEFDPDTRQMATCAATAKSSAICFGTLVQWDERSRSTLLEFLDASPSSIKILDLNLRLPLPSRETVSRSLDLADVLKCNLEELQQLAVWFELAERTKGAMIAEQLQSQFELRAVFWTRGADGCCWQAGADQIVAEVPRLVAEPHADSVGAGDAASAALAVGLVLNWPPQRIVAAANLCGAFAASCRGATTPLSQSVLDRLT